MGFGLRHGHDLNHLGGDVFERGGVLLQLSDDPLNTDEAFFGVVGVIHCSGSLPLPPGGALFYSGHGAMAWQQFLRVCAICGTLQLAPFH